MKRLARALAISGVLIATVLSNASAAMMPLIPMTPPLLAGKYQQVAPGTRRLSNPGNLVILQEKNGQFLFSVNAIRSHDLNSGYISGTLPQGVSKAIWTNMSANTKCRLTFTRTPNGMTIVQDTQYGDCGFGYGVTATGTYLRTAPSATINKQQR